MAQKLYVGNLPFTATEEDVRALFAMHGHVYSVQLILDRETGRPRGFGFVEMEDGREAIQALDGQEFGGRNLRVNAARERESGDERGGFRGGRPRGRR